MNYIIRVENLEKNYGSNQVLKDVSFHVEKGEIFALLGVNGAGKTTTLECMEGLRKYNSGSIQIDGTYGVQSQSSSIPKNMKACESLSLFAKWQHTKIKDDLLLRLGIKSFENKQYSQLSTGQKRRLHLALALLGNPDIVFLDEPTAGLDVEGRISIHKEIANLKEQGKTIILASHDMAEIESLCDKIAILREGKIVFIGTSQQLTNTQNKHFMLKVQFSNQHDFENCTLSNYNSDEKGYYLFETSNLEDTLTDIIQYCSMSQISINDVRVEHVGLEQRFLEIAKEDLK